MAWHPTLSALREVLVDLFPRRDESELIVDEAGIPRLVFWMLGWLVWPFSGQVSFLHAFG
jgi:hypothetical protein